MLNRPDHIVIHTAGLRMAQPETNAGTAMALRLLLVLCLLLAAIQARSQEEKKILRKGNEAYFSGKSLEAARDYKNSLKEKGDYHKANFNLGDALYKTAMEIKTGKMKSPDPKMTPDSAANIVFEQAAQQFEVVAKSVSNGDTIQKAWHNYGNAKLMQKNYEDAITAYKKSLKINPKDEDTRYNLAYALTQMKKQQNNQNKNQDNKKDQKKDQQKQEQDKQQPKNQDKEDNQPQPEMSKQQAEQILNALKNAEKKNQAVRKKKDSGEKSKPEKDW